LVGLLAAVSSVVVAYFAADAFQRPINLPDLSIVPPRYMTPPRQYRIGQMAYTFLCLAIYALIIANYKWLLWISKLVGPPQFRQMIDAALSDNEILFPAICAMLVALLRLEHKANPFFALRRLILTWVSIPALALYIINEIVHHLAVPERERLRITEELQIHVDAGDFDKDRWSLDRKWAEVSYLRFWLHSRISGGRHNIFFNEPSFRWLELDSYYGLCLKEIIRLKQAPIKLELRSRDLSEIVAMVERLRRQYCDVSALFILYTSDSKKRALNTVRELGVYQELGSARTNPIRYVVLFILAILISIYLGAGLSVALWDVTHPSSGASF
jgi:hypothetical protein